jgi:hypothetical protein
VVPAATQLVASGRKALVAMVQATDLRDDDDSAAPPCQFPAYPRRSHSEFSLPDPSNEIADLKVDPGAAARSAGLPPPIGPKAALMPHTE